MPRVFVGKNVKQSEFGLLNCVGFVTDWNKKRVRFLF
ncbi:unnamed protein product [Arabidopsis halleri]